MSSPPCSIVLVLQGFSPVGVTLTIEGLELLQQQKQIAIMPQQPQGQQQQRQFNGQNVYQRKPVQEFNAMTKEPTKHTNQQAFQRSKRAL